MACKEGVDFLRKHGHLTVRDLRNRVKEYLEGKEEEEKKVNGMVLTLLYRLENGVGFMAEVVRKSVLRPWLVRSMKEYKRPFILMPMVMDLETRVLWSTDVRLLLINQAMERIGALC